MLREGLSAAALLQRLTYGDPDAPHRQLGVVDRDYRLVSYTGSRCLPWAGGMCGSTYAVQGNLLAGPQVVEAMASTYEALREAAVRVPTRSGVAGRRRGRGRSKGPAVGRAEDLARLRDAGRHRRSSPTYGWTTPSFPCTVSPRSSRGTGWSTAPLAGDARARGRGRGPRAASPRPLPTADAGAALADWASMRNLERRVRAGRPRRGALEVLEHGERGVLARIAADPPPVGWPAMSTLSSASPEPHQSLVGGVSQRRAVVRRLWRNRVARVSLVYIVLVVILATRRAARRTGHRPPAERHLAPVRHDDGSRHPERPELGASVSMSEQTSSDVTSSSESPTARGSRS